MIPARISFARVAARQQIRSISKSTMKKAGEIPPLGDRTESGTSESSARIQAFREKLKLDPIPRVSPGVRFIDLMLVKTNPNTGELISDAEKDPTKWGDWQNGGRVSDF